MRENRLSGGVGGVAGNSCHPDPIDRGRMAPTERRCVTGLNRTWVQPRPAALRANEREAPARTPKAGHRPALRPRANGTHGAPVCHRLKPYLAATPASSAENKRTRNIAEPDLDTDLWRW